MDVFRKELKTRYLYVADVVNVVDGDTVDVDIDLGFYAALRRQRLRLLGINAWERNCQEGLDAKLFLEMLVMQRTVALETVKTAKLDDKTGKYGRWLAKLYVPCGWYDVLAGVAIVPPEREGLYLVNRLLVANGHAVWEKY